MRPGEQTCKGNNPEEDTSEREVIRVCFKAQDGNKDYFKVRKDSKIQNMLQAYCRKTQMDYKTVVFLYEGSRLPYRGTLNQVGLVDQAEVEVMVHQTAGGGGSTDSVM